mmetsp:Transcript_9932/g.29823  ORF Transcript_9932/g.29823 Transcript_9932/m.29823 type:complete len:356 (+) Transcript_9932:110-1177(+)
MPPERTKSLLDQLQEQVPVGLDGDFGGDEKKQSTVETGAQQAQGAPKSLAGAPPAPKVVQKLVTGLTPQQTVLRDKVGFVAGISNIAITAFWMAKSPQTFYWWYTSKSVLLYGLRFLIYRSKKQQYYMLEMCYFTNLVLLASLWLFPNTELLYKATFGLVAGPLTWSIVALHNSLVLHSLDQMTSLFMHSSPALVIYAMRWYPSSSMVQSNFVTQPQYHTASFAQLVGGSMGLYSIWAVVYYLKVFVVSAQRIRDENYDTLYTLMTRNKNGLVARVVFSVSKPFQPVVYMLAHASLCLLASISATLWWRSFWAHSAFIMVMLLGATWNGASFYFDHFSRKYAAKTGLDPDKKKAS